MQEWSSDWEVDAEIRQGLVELERYVGCWAAFSDWESAQADAAEKEKGRPEGRP